MGPEGVVLKDQADPPSLRWKVMDESAVEVNLAVVQRLQARDQPGHRGLSRPRRPEHERQLAGADLHRGPIDDRDLVVTLDQIFQDDPDHEGT